MLKVEKFRAADCLTGLTKKPEERSFIDSLRDTVRNSRLMTIVLAIGIAAGCTGTCRFGKNRNEAFSCSCTDTDGSSKKKSPTYKELKEDKKDTSDL